MIEEVLLESLLPNGSEHWLTRLKDKKIEKASTIQYQAIPPALAGRDVFAQAQTGSGKTLAYLLPLLQRIDLAIKHPQAMVIVPTRELAMQVYRELQFLLEGHAIQAQVLAGGADLKRQLEKLKNHPQVVVGTPGRLCELIRLRKLRMHDVKVIVADEVDQLVSAGFVADVESIIQHALRDRQLLFFSATIDGNVRKLAGKWMRDPLEIAIAAETKTVTTLKQYALMTDERDKIDDVRRLVHALKPRSALVFANDAHELGEMVAKWQYAGLSVDAIYSGQGQMERADVMRKFREGKLSILVATDVAARGLDFADLDLVINYDLPETEEHYLHRVGRTARMGRSGTAVTFVCSYERKKLARLGRRILASIEERKLVRGQLRTVSSKEK